MRLQSNGLLDCLEGKGDREQVMRLVVSYARGFSLKKMKNLLYFLVRFCTFEVSATFSCISKQSIEASIVVLIWETAIVKLKQQMAANLDLRRVYTFFCFIHPLNAQLDVFQ